ncbi:hypothetical protein H0H93_009477 [Arthromyces matolae]|nr:hypothetical protein H0H93_009477 [Arthromyces matolae]
MEDDIYRGMFIPKGSLMIANARAMGLDENVYRAPHVFDPSRYLSHPQGRSEPRPSASFGFGRRICPGRHLADASVWIAIACVLATFDIQKPIGPNGKEITPEVTLSNGITRSHFSGIIFLHCILPLLNVDRRRMMDSLHMAFIMHAVYHYAIKNYGMSATLEVPVWSIMHFLNAAFAGTISSDLLIAGSFIVSLSKYRTGFRNCLAALNSREELWEKCFGGIAINSTTASSGFRRVPFTNSLQLVRSISTNAEKAIDENCPPTNVVDDIEMQTKGDTDNLPPHPLNPSHT